ncbi:hypothetical protein RB213_009710 [Colletotrichum asianum]
MRTPMSTPKTRRWVTAPWLRAVVGSGAPSVNCPGFRHHPPLRPHPLRLRACVQTPKFDVPCSYVFDFRQKKRIGPERRRVNLSSETAESHG